MAEALRSTLRAHPDLVVFGHLHFARLAPFVRVLAPGSGYWALAYGIEAWYPLSPAIRRGLAWVEKVLAISDFTRRELARNGGPPVERIELQPCALDPVWQDQYESRPDAAPSMPTGRPPTLLTVARLAASERYKGVDSVIRALPAVAEKVPDVHYDVVGDGDDRPRLEALAAEMGVEERVRFRGRLWPDELADAYRDCTLYVMPSSHEGFGIVFLEAALFEKPSIGGRHGGTPEVVNDGRTGLLVDRGDIEALVVAITGMLTDDVARSRMGAEAKARLLSGLAYPAFRAAIWRHLNGIGQGRPIARTISRSGCQEREAE